MTILEMQAKLQSMSIDDLVAVWNEYQSEINDDSQLYTNDEYTINELFATPWDVLTSLDSDYSRYDEYCYIDGYGYLCSINAYVARQRIDIYNLADWAIEFGIEL